MELLLGGRVGAGSGGRFEIWLAIDRNYLPVRALFAEDSGPEGELTIRSITAAE